jgi:6-phosphogluconolactonase (cycloisomerase 2 family)
MLSPDYKGRVGAADIHVSTDGNFLYASNRGDANEIVIYSIDKNILFEKDLPDMCLVPSGNYN